MLKLYLIILIFLNVFVFNEFLTTSDKKCNVNVFDYHRRIGIPEAKRIKEYEDKINKQRIVGGFGIDITQTPYQVNIFLYKKGIIL